MHLLRGQRPAGAGRHPGRPASVGWLGDRCWTCPALNCGSTPCSEGLSWIEDPSNRDTGFDRNFLRRDVAGAAAPLAAGKPWLARSAGLAFEAAGLLDELAEQDLASVANVGPAGLRRAAAAVACAGAQPAAVVFAPAGPQAAGIITTGRRPRSIA